MNARENELVSALERAARGSDESAFDAAFDRLLEGAHGAATPSADLRALVGTRLFGELAAVDGQGHSAPEDAAEGSAAEGFAARRLSPAKPGERSAILQEARAPQPAPLSDRASGSESALPHAMPGRVARGPITGTVSRAVQWSRGLALLTAGVAIGFVWGRSPQWSSNPEQERSARSAEAARGLEERTADGARPLAQPVPVTNAASERTGSPSDSTGSAPLEPPPATPEASNPTSPASPSRPLAATASAPTAAASSAPTAISAPSNAPVSPPRAHGLSPRAHSRAGASPGDSAVSDAVRRTVPPAGSNADALRFALEQLRQAQLFLRGHEPVRALDALDALDARVAPAILQDEREVMRTLALCDAGDEARANALARRVLERAPDSAYAASLRESCAGRSALLEQMRERTSNPPR